ncbi:MAG: adenylosuccinate synthase [Bacteroidales bacterium]|nr:adenylosuccinate synthase [Bacteroidales bacterium]
MKLDILLGLQWGDEGKGKIVDYLTPNYKIVARFQGGPNAGHTLVFDNQKFVLHLIPSGIFREETINVIGNGVVFDPVTFDEEVKSISSHANVKSNLVISNRTHLILPTHKLLDAANEAAKGKSKIGSTLKGITPTYNDKTGRNGLRIGDILSKDFDNKLHLLIEKHKQMLDFYNFEYNLDVLLPDWLNAIENLRKYKIQNTEYLLNNELKKGNAILAEGAQGTMLDIEFGTYPFVTSSNTISAGANTGLGIAPNKVDKVYGIFKAYTTRVGSGPFPTELFDNDGKKLQDKGHEFGATTGRPRRCGWLDLVVLNFSTMINGVTDLIMTKADILTSFENIKVATKYIIDNKETTELPYDIINKEITPFYDIISGWQEDISKITDYNLLPQTLKNYVEYVEKQTSTKVSLISTGAEREAIIQKN